MNKINLRIKQLTIILLVYISTLYAVEADAIVGKYHLPNKLDIEIFKQGGKYYGKIIGLNDFNDGQLTDIHNPEKSKQNDPIIGKIIIKDLEFDASENQWVNGSMYGPEKGLIFNLKISEFRETEIEVVGSKFLFWKTLIWEKLDTEQDS